MVDFGSALRKGLAFAIDPKRWLPLFVLDVTIAGIFITALLNNITPIMDSMVLSGGTMTGDALLSSSLPGMILGLILLGFVWFILRMWIAGSLIHQSVRPMEINKGYRLSLSRLHKIIAVIIIVSIISGLVGIVPYIGWIFSIIIGLFFFFILQGIVVDNLGAIGSMKNSWNMFRKSTFDVFIAWLLITVISIGIVVLFALPLIFMFIGVLFSLISMSGTVDPGALAFLVMYLQTNFAQVVAFGLIAMLGLEISQAFALKAQTEFYLQLKKKFPSLMNLVKNSIGRFF